MHDKIKSDFYNNFDSTYNLTSFYILSLYLKVMLKSKTLSSSTSNCQPERKTRPVTCPQCSTCHKLFKRFVWNTKVNITAGYKTIWSMGKGILWEHFIGNSMISGKDLLGLQYSIVANGRLVINYYFIISQMIDRWWFSASTDPKVLLM